MPAKDSSASPAVLFIAHGSPMVAIRPGGAGAALSALAEELARPRAVLVISPHWETLVATVGSAAQLETIHDVRGFDPALDAIQYPAMGSPQGAQEVVAALEAAGQPARIDPRRGLDHGGPQHAHRIGQALAPLAEQGWLIVATGNITHNLRDWQQAGRGAAIDGRYAQRFSDWVHGQLISGDTQALLRYRERHPDARRAQPRDEHLLPLVCALGAAGAGATVRAIHRGISDHGLATDSYAFEPASAQPSSLPPVDGAGIPG